MAWLGSSVQMTEPGGVVGGTCPAPTGGARAGAQGLGRHRPPVGIGGASGSGQLGSEGLFVVPGTSVRADAPATFGGVSRGLASRAKGAAHGSSVPGESHALTLPPSLRRSKFPGSTAGSGGALDSMSSALDTLSTAGPMVGPGASLMQGSSASAGFGSGSLGLLGLGGVAGTMGGHGHGSGNGGGRAAVQLVRALASLEEAAARRSESAALLEVAALERQAKAAQAAKGALRKHDIATRALLRQS